MEHSQIFVALLLVPVTLQILFPLSLLAAATLIGLCRHLLASLSTRPEDVAVPERLMAEKA